MVMRTTITVVIWYKVWRCDALVQKPYKNCPDMSLHQGAVSHVANLSFKLHLSLFLSGSIIISPWREDSWCHPSGRWRHSCWTSRWTLSSSAATSCWGKDGVVFFFPFLLVRAILGPKTCHMFSELVFIRATDLWSLNTMWLFMHFIVRISNLVWAQTVLPENDPNHASLDHDAHYRLKM